MWVTQWGWAFGSRISAPGSKFQTANRESRIPNMLLAIDVGNTNIVLGVFDEERLVESWRLATLRERTADEIGILVTHLFERSRMPLEQIDGIILSSVVPPLTR